MHTPLNLYKSRISVLQSIDEITENSILLNTSVIDDEGNPNSVFMHYFYSICRMKGKSYLVKLSVEELNSRNGAIRRAYNVNNKDNGIKTSDILSDLGYDGVHDGSEWVAFNSNQLKSATGNIGTFDRENPDINFSANPDADLETLRAENWRLRQNIEWLKRVEANEVLEKDVRYEAGRLFPESF